MAYRYNPHDPNERMERIAFGAGAPPWPTEMLAELDVTRVRGWLEALDRNLADTRALRRQLQGLLDGSPSRTCESCGKPFPGKATARYCSSTCRVRAHRNGKRALPNG